MEILQSEHRQMKLAKLKATLMEKSARLIRLDYKILDLLCSKGIKAETAEAQVV